MVMVQEALPPALAQLTEQQIQCSSTYLLPVLVATAYSSLLHSYDPVQVVSMF